MKLINLSLALLCVGCAQSHGCRGWDEGETAYVWIDDPDGKFTPEQVEIIHQAVEEWEIALNGFINFEFIDGKGPDALIVIRADSHENIVEDRGHDIVLAYTDYVPWEQGGGITLPFDFSNEAFHGLLLHELGHTLGLEHDTPDTLMHWKYRPEVNHITCGDIEQFCEQNLCIPASFPPCQDASTNGDDDR